MKSRFDDTKPSGWRRLKRWRTPVIALLSLAILLVSAVWTWDVDPAELWAYLVASIIGLAALIGLAFLTSLALRWLRRR